MDFSKLTGWTGKIQHSVLGVLLWDESIDIAMIEQSILGPSIRLMERLPRDENVFAAVASRLAALEKSPSRVVLCMPRSETVLRTLRYPAMVLNDLDQMVPFEATRHLPFPEAERCLGFASAVCEDGKNIDVQLLAARKERVDEYISQLQAVGLPVDSVLAFSPLVAAGLGDLPSVLVVSDRGHTEIALICGGLVCDSMRVAETGAPPLGDVVQRMLASNEERLGAAGVARLVFAGPVALPADCKEALCVSLGLSATELAVPDAVEPALAEWNGDLFPEGLAVANGTVPASLSLIEPTRQRMPMSHQSKWIFGLSALLLVELIAGWGFWTTAPGRAQGRVDKELAELRRRAAPIQRLKDQNREMYSNLAHLHDLVNSRMSVMEVFKTLSDTFPEDTYLMSVKYERGDEIRIRGRSKEPDKLPGLLLDIPFVSTLEDSDIDEKKGEYHTFSMTVALKGASHE